MNNYKNVKFGLRDYISRLATATKSSPAAILHNICVYIQIYSIILRTNLLQGSLR